MKKLCAIIFILLQFTTISFAEERNAFDISSYLNIVSVSGQAEPNKFVTIGVSEDEQSENLVNVKQTKTDSSGLFGGLVGLDPEKYDSGTYYIHVAVKGTAKYTQSVELTGKNDFENMISNFKDAFANENYEAAAEKYFDVLCGVNVEKSLYSKVISERAKEEFDTAAFENIKEFAEHIKAAAEYANKYAVAISEVNTAAKNEKWAEIKKAVFEDYGDCFGIDKSVLNGINDEKSLFTRMFNKSYTSISEICDALDEAVKAEKSAQDSGKKNNSGGGSSGGGYTGGGKVSAPIGGNIINVIKQPKEQIPENLPSEPFADENDVSWAAGSITLLRQKGIINGSGDGYFYPNRSVTRTEFLKMVMKVFRTDTDTETAEIMLNDVNKDYWGYDYIVTAVKLGIVKGDENGNFNGDDGITRADMAVIVRRMTDKKQITLAHTEPSVIFSDAYLIPKYAYDDISDLQQAGILSGDGDVFNPTGNLSRAEAAVVFERLLKTYGEELARS